MSQSYPEIETGINEIASQESQRRGFSDCVVDRKDIANFWNDINTTSCTSEDETAETKTFQNDTDTDYTVPYTEKRTSVTAISAKIQSELQFEMANNTNQGELKLRGSSAYNSKKTVEMQFGDVTLQARSAVAIQDTLHKTQNDLEVRALAFYRFRVYPGHPVAKGAAVGGSAGAGMGALAGGGAGAGIGSVVGLLGGPIGLAIGAVVGSVVGVVSGAIVGASGGGAVGAGFGVRKRRQRQFPITAKDVFAIMPGFREDGRFVFCTVRRRHAWRETRYTVK